VVKKVAVCGGSGSFLLGAAMASGADVFITADYKYHQFFDADGKISILDVGHFESEQFTIDLIADFIEKNFPKFAVLKTEVNTNPIQYY
jgi:putative NIF3 family GTP cyclohydrolase 1 type 2